MKIKIYLAEKWWKDEISERNCKFVCEDCGREIYGKNGN